MTVNDLLKRVDKEDYDKVIIINDGKGWTNITGKVSVDNSKIVLFLDDNCIYGDD